MNLAKYFDHTNLNPAASSSEIEKLCDEAKEYGFFSVCVHPFYIEKVREALAGSAVKITTVVGFPLGQNTSAQKAGETREAVELGADEIDMVINYGALKEGLDDLVLEDLIAVRKACEGHVLKVILETSQLSDEEKRRACELCRKAGADFVKTSTGFRGEGAKVEDVRLMKESFGGEVKASGGIRNKEDALAMIEAGASRIGASAGVAIMKS